MDHWSGSRTSVNARRGKSEEALEVCQPRKSESSRVESRKIIDLLNAIHQFLRKLVSFFSLISAETEMN